MKKLMVLLFLLPGVFLLSSCGEEDDEPAPSKVVVTKFRVKKFPPLTGEGDSWDGTSSSSGSPDLLMQISTDSTLIWKAPQPYQNVSGLYFYEFVPSSYLILDGKDSYTLTLFDSDGSMGNESMGEIAFNPTDEVDELSGSFTVNNDEIAVEVFVKYIF